MTIKTNNEIEDEVNYTQNNLDKLNNPSIKHNRTKPIDSVKKNNLVLAEVSNNNVSSSIKSEYKIIPKNDDKLCLMDPVILFWIISITGILLYIVGHKYKSK